MPIYNTPLLTKFQLKRLLKHKYVSKGSSVLDRFLQPYWNWLVSKLPRWLAPNLITLIGAAANLVTSAVLIFYSPNAKLEPPRWALGLSCFGVFIYQTLDAVDGKQARRIQNSTPLGELFDHGCDSLSTIFLGLVLCIALKLGNNPQWMLYECLAGMTLFYLSHWRTYVTGTLTFSKFDVTEAQCCIMSILLLSTIFSTDVWHFDVYKTWKLWHVIIGLTLTFGGILAYNSIKVILTCGVGKNGSTVADSSVLTPVVPISLFVTMSIAIAKKSEQRVYLNQPVLYIVSFGFIFAKITNKLIISHMTKSEIGTFDRSFLGPILLVLNQYFNTFFNEDRLLYFAFVYGLVDFTIYTWKVCNEICDYLDVKMFRIGKH